MVGGQFVPTPHLSNYVNAPSPLNVWCICQESQVVEYRTNGWLGRWYICYLHRGSNCMLAWAMDGRVMCCSTITSCNHSDATYLLTSGNVKSYWWQVTHYSCISDAVASVETITFGFSRPTFSGCLGKFTEQFCEQVLRLFQLDGKTTHIVGLVNMGSRSQREKKTSEFIEMTSHHTTSVTADDQTSLKYSAITLQSLQMLNVKKGL